MATPYRSNFGGGGSSSDNTAELIQELIKSGALDNPSLWDQTKKAGAGFLSGVFKTLNAPLAAGTALVTGRPIWESVKEGLTPSQVINPNPSGLLDQGGNLAIDVLLDPVTWLTFGTAPAAQRALLNGESRALSSLGAKELERLGAEEFLRATAKDAAFDLATRPAKGLGFSTNPFGSDEVQAMLLPQEDIYKGLSSALQTVQKTPVAGNIMEGGFNALNKVFGADSASNRAIYDALTTAPETLPQVLRNASELQDLRNVQLRETQLRTGQMVEQNKELAKLFQGQGVELPDAVRMVETRQAYPEDVMKALDSYGEATRKVNRLDNTMQELLTKKSGANLTKNEAKYLTKLLDESNGPRAKAITIQGEMEDALNNLLTGVEKTSDPTTVAARYLIDQAKDLMKRDAALGLDYRPMNDYVARMITPEASEAMFGKASRYTSSGSTAATIGRFGKHRTQTAPLEEAAANLRADYFVPPTVKDIYEPNPFIASSVREASTIKAETTRELYEGVANSSMAMPVSEKMAGKPILTDSKGIKYRVPDVAFFKERRIALPMPIAENMEKTGAVLTGGPQAKEFIQAYDKVNSFFKSANTVFFPGFHFGNAVGGIYNNWLAGTFSPQMYMDANQLAGKMEALRAFRGVGDTRLVNVAAGEAGDLGVLLNRANGSIDVSLPTLRKLFEDKDFVKSLGGDLKTFEEFKDFMVNRELIKESLGAGIAGQSVDDDLINSIAGTVDKVGNKNRQQALLEQLGKFKMKDINGKVWTGEDIMKQYESHVGYESGMRQEIASSMRDALQPKTGLARGGEMLNDVTGKAYSFVEDRIRLPLFLDTLKKTGSVEQAAKKVFEFHFDYSPEAMSKVESEVIRRIIPFYTWTRRNVPLQIAQFLKQPGKQMLALRAQQNLVNPDVRAELPDWMQEQLVIQTNSDNQNPNLISGLRLPIFDLNNLTPGDIISNMTPALRLPIEMATDNSFFYDKAITDMGTSLGKDYQSFPFSLLQPAVGYGEFKSKSGDQVPYVDPVLAYPVSQFLGRFARTGTQFSNQFEESSGSVIPGIPNDTIRVVTGIRPETKSAADLKEAKDQELAEELTKLLKRKGVIGTYERTYTRNK